MESVTRPLAEVKVPNKTKYCPTLTAGHIDPLVFYNWGVACRRFAKHSEKKPGEIVSFVATAMLEPWLVAWYYSDFERIDKLSLDEYLEELAKLVLPRNWATKIRNEILSSTQGAKCFMDWKMELESLNAILYVTSRPHALDITTLKAHLEANINAELKPAIENEGFLCTGSESNE
ncbi:hypothetical protein BDQ12DRAFT_352993 [Crucibulum laeve]|uniref:Retrotransposon gag domain-containing protein n=1 Tax=Crucibulum laeve TaxID=68775 RepID=A0A5C3M9Z8_9AGAR|nr:hypothetical protein BDQ12DRAFT_352993 [Crucibulum laeve]